MTQRSTILALFTLALAAANFAAPLAANQLKASEPIDMALEDALLSETLQSFSAIAGARLDMDPDVEGEVTIHLEAVPWIKALDQVCREHAIYCAMTGDPPTLFVRNAATGELPAGYAEPINLSLLGGDLREVLSFFSQLSAVELSVADDVQGKVTVELHATPWPLILEEVCRLNGCQVVWGADQVRIDAVPGEVPVLNMSLKGADLEKTLGYFGKLGILGASDLDVEVAAGVTGTVTADLEHVTWQQALDVICAQLSCMWAVTYGDPPRLEVKPVSDKVRAAKAPGEPAAAAKELAYRFTPPGGRPVAGTAVFTWAEPIHLVAPAGPYRARLTWLPFGPELSVLLPLIERCDGGQTSVSVLDPVVLPVERRVRHQVEGAVLDLLPAGEGAPEDAAPAKAQSSCGPRLTGEIRVFVKRRAGDEPGPRPSRLQAVESYLLVRPVEAREPVAAVVALGGGPGERSLALLRPTDDRAGVEVETLSLAPGERFEKVVSADGVSFELTVEYLAASGGE